MSSSQGQTCARG